MSSGRVLVSRARLMEVMAMKPAPITRAVRASSIMTDLSAGSERSGVAASGHDKYSWVPQGGRGDSAPKDPADDAGPRSRAHRKLCGMNERNLRAGHLSSLPFAVR